MAKNSMNNAIRGCTYKDFLAKRRATRTMERSDLVQIRQPVAQRPQPALSAAERTERQHRRDVVNRQVGRRLQQTRRDRGMSHADLAIRAGLSETDLARFERGSSRPSPKAFLALADALVVPIRHLFPQ